MIARSVRSCSLVFIVESVFAIFVVTLVSVERFASVVIPLEVAPVVASRATSVVSSLEVVVPVVVSEFSAVLAAELFAVLAVPEVASAVVALFLSARKAVARVVLEAGLEVAMLLESLAVGHHASFLSGLDVAASGL